MVPSVTEAGAAPSVVPQKPDLEAIVRTLTNYADALTQMDVRSAAQSWPSVDERALTQAFKTLESNRVMLTPCAIEVGADDGVVATCGAKVEYVPKIGRRTPRLASQQWRFTMNKISDEWKIQTARVFEER